MDESVFFDPIIAKYNACYSPTTTIPQLTVTGLQHNTGRDNYDNVQYYEIAAAPSGRLPSVDAQKHNKVAENTEEYVDIIT